MFSASSVSGGLRPVKAVLVCTCRRLKPKLGPAPEPSRRCARHEKQQKEDDSRSCCDLNSFVAPERTLPLASAKYAFPHRYIKDREFINREEGGYDESQQPSVPVGALVFGVNQNNPMFSNQPLAEVRSVSRAVRPRLSHPNDVPQFHIGRAVVRNRAALLVGV